MEKPVMSTGFSIFDEGYRWNGIVEVEVQQGDVLPRGVS
jgi:hypothetical protein